MNSAASPPSGAPTKASPPPRTWQPPRASLSGQGSVARNLTAIQEKVLGDTRISSEEALYLHAHADLLLLGQLSDAVRHRKHPSKRVTYIVDRNINPTNVCVTDCGFCAFYRRPKHAEAYVLERDEILEKVKVTAELGGRQLLMQGGHHPKIQSDWWCDLIADINSKYPQVNCHALSAPELDFFSVIEKRPIEDILEELKAAGLGSVPGAGAEILVERVRKIIAPKKTTTDRWLEVHRKVHEAGLRSSATMMFGNVETPAERIEHLVRLRDLQDKTGGFTAFACWNTQPEGVPEEHLYPKKSTPVEYLRVNAVARIFLDNIENFQTSYVTQGMKMAQLSLRFGCNDFGGTMLEENVVSAAGCSNLQSIQVIEQTIERAGFLPRQRNSWYGIVDERHGKAPYPSCATEARPTPPTAGQA